MKLQKKTASAVTRNAPPPYSCTVEHTLKPVSCPGVTSSGAAAAASTRLRVFHGRKTQPTAYLFKGAAGVPVPHWRDPNVHVCRPKKSLSWLAHACCLMAHAWRTSCSAPGSRACHSRRWKQPPHTMAVVRTRLLFSGVCIVKVLAAKHQAACFAWATLQPVDMLSVRRKGGWLEANLAMSNLVLLCNTPEA